MGVTASAFGLGATLSNYVGQLVVEKFDHVTSLTASMFLSIIPLVIFSFMPETLGKRATKNHPPSPQKGTPYRGENDKDVTKESPPLLNIASSYGSTGESSSSSSPVSNSNKFW